MSMTWLQLQGLARTLLNARFVVLDSRSNAHSCSSSFDVSTRLCPRLEHSFPLRTYLTRRLPTLPNCTPSVLLHQALPEGAGVMNQLFLADSKLLTGNEAASVQAIVQKAARSAESEELLAVQAQVGLMACWWGV